MKRGRNQRRRQGGANPNRALDSNGPDVRIRGTANQIYDKYQGLARDAASSGDRVKAENYLQHAEHYFRLIKSMQPAQPPASQQTESSAGEGEQPSVGDEQSRGQSRSNGVDRETSERSAEPDIAPAERAEGADSQSAGDDAEEEKKPRRRRPRRSAKKTNDEETPAPESDGEAVAS